MELAVPIADAARMLHISRAQAFRLAAEGTLPTVPIGRRGRRVPVEALRRWLEEPAPRETARPQGGDLES